MNGNLGGTYKSFLERCLRGVHKERETFPELAKAMEDFQALQKRGHALGLPEGWEFKGAGEVAESYRQGKEAFEKEGDVYAVLSALANIARHCEEVLKRRETAVREKAEYTNRVLQAAENALREAEMEAEKAKKEKEKAETEAKKKKEESDGAGCLLLTFFLLCLMGAAIVYRLGDKTGVPWLVFVPLAVLIVFHVRKQGRKSEMQETLNKLDAAARNATAMLKQRQTEAETARAEAEKAAALGDIKQNPCPVDKCKDLNHFVIDATRCRGCTACARKCPVGAISGERQKSHVIDQNKCVKCGTCFRICRFDAISCNPATEKVPMSGKTKTLALPGGAKMEMVWCPPGTFMMGSPENEEEREDDEIQHQVTLTQGFWMAKTQVTQKQWQSVMGNNPSEYKGYNLPVEKVSWDDCQEFCQRTGLQLPTEAQWEYACRAGETGPYAGTGKLEEMGWYKDNSGEETHPVGLKRPNMWGLYDMHGNVAEWCEDWFGDYPGGAVMNPTGADSGFLRVLRGGSYGVNAKFCRSARRSKRNPRVICDNYGFRPVARQLN